MGRSTLTASSVHAAATLPEVVEVQAQALAENSGFRLDLSSSSCHRGGQVLQLSPEFGT
jgi:hypothetical protein